MGLHDRSYRLLFSEPRLVEELIRGFFKEPWTKRLDFTTLERMSSVYVTDGLQGREGDMVWRLRFDDGPARLHLPVAGIPIDPGPLHGGPDDGI